MEKMLDEEYQKFTITRLEESEVERLGEFLHENPQLWGNNGCLTIALEYEGMKILCTKYEPRGVKGRSPSVAAVMLEDRIVCAECFCERGEDRLMHGGVSVGTGDGEIDGLLRQASYYFPLYEENFFSWIIEDASDGSEAYDEYGEEYERIREEIIRTEQEMQKKYVADL